MHLRLPAALACGAGVLIVSCGGSPSASPSPSQSAAATAAPTPVPPPPPSAVVQLTDQDLLDLAHAHRIRTATISPTTIAGTMASDIGPDQQFSAPRPQAIGALNELTTTLRQAGAVVTGGTPATPARRAAAAG